MGYIIGDPTFIKHLDDWLFKNEQRSAKWIASKENQIPPIFRTFSGYLYRGMTVDDKFFQNMNSGKISFDKFTSWTKNEKIAKAFSGEKGSTYSFTKHQGTSILIKKKIDPSSIVMDIHAFVAFMGMDQMMMLGLDETNYDSGFKEEEVLIKPRVQIRKSEIKVL